MKLKGGYLLKEVAGEYVLFPVGQNVVDSKRIVRTNETGRFIVKKLQDGVDFDTLVHALAEKYEASEEDMPRLKADADFFLAKLRLQELLIE